MESVRRDLREKVGIRPSEHWWSDCLSALSLRRNSPQADDVLEQILHHDLRDVVRAFEENNLVDLPSVGLRQAIQQSQQGPHYRADLPASFALLVQVEEFLDISTNAMKRLELGPTASADPSPVGNQSKRCLKLAYTDGYESRTGTPFYNENQPPQDDAVMVAMEIQPIPDLSSHSNAGLKVLLKGPLTIRRGVAFWHPGNTTVIGGRVAALVEIQRQALSQAKRLAGVGVDPTIRALIGTQSNLVEEEDEGEHESGDVVPQPPRAPPATTIISPPPVPPPTMGPPRPMEQSARFQVVSASRPPPRPAVPSRNPYAAASTHHPATAPSNRNPPLTTVSTSPPQMTRNPSNSYSMSASSTSSNRSNPYASRGNPYASSSQSTASVSPAAPIIGQSSANPYVSSTTAGNSRTNPYVSSTTAGSSRTNPYARARPETAVRPTHASTAGGTAGDDGMETSDRTNDGGVIPMEMETVALTPVASGSMISFAALHARLLGFVQSTGEDYRRAMGETWLVDLEMIGTRVDFNIASKKRPGSKKKDYEYWLLFKFGGDAQETGPLITCQLDSATVEASFGHSAAVLRALRKTRSTEAQQICKDGGQQLMSLLVVRQTWRVRLVELDENYWQQTERTLDSKQPILYIQAPT
jgi:hypothetical protein